MQIRLKTTKNCLEAEGVLIPFDPAIITPAIKHAIESGYFEAEEAAQLPHIVKPEDIVLDIGAGIGFISTLIARRADRVISVEANPDLLPYMAALHQLNGVENATQLNVVLGDAETGLTTFYQRNDFWMGSLSKGPNPYKSTIKVPNMALNALLKKENVTLIVCDIEGAETILFRNADLNGVDRVYLELHDHITGLKGVASVFEAMASRGFAYDPRYSSGAIVLFQRVDKNETLRPYARLELT
ncbi:MAG: FkbM family methyltransferase [Rhodobacteraceae bacterium]|nr:FkbM family methyltransferase [Paracoccaceae bacterium]